MEKIVADKVIARKKNSRKYKVTAVVIERE
jgi:hypothetical protein